MELDSQSLDSDEGVELSVKEHEDLYPGDFLYSEETESTVLEAKAVYLLLPKDVPVSRASRLQWLLDHLNTVITVPVLQKWNVSSNDIEIVSAIAREQQISKCNRYLVTCRTEVIFLAHSYRFVYCLDMSPSQCIVDIQKGEILFDEILNSFKTSVEGLTRQFTIPGNSLVFQPSLYLTVMVNTPFFMSPAQQVLVKGVQITSTNLHEIVAFVQSQFHVLEGKIADVTAMVHDQNERQKTQNERIVGSLFDLPENEKNTKVPMVSPDANFVNMLRYSMLAVSLLPENSISHILVITDGVVAMPDSNIMETLLFQLHYDSIAVSFIKVGSSFHPHSSAGYISYTDLLNFFSHSTMGTCLETSPDIHEPSMPMNIYHELFLLWSFHSAVRCDYRKGHDLAKWRSPNDNFYSHKTPNLLSKRQTDDTTSASILLLLSRRMREGFAVENINYLNGMIEVQLGLQWKSLIYIIYKLSSQWPVVKNNTHLEIFILAPYEFLHDITCLIKKDSKSLYRQAIIERFWMRLSQLSSADLNFAQQLTNFQNSNVWYTLPESVRSGIPVFNLNSPCPDSNSLLLSPSSTTCPKFVNSWQGICQMEASNWRKWFHTHKVSLILKHDNPLPKHLHLPNSSQRYQVVQCRQAATALYGKLSEWASFVLIDNHTYLKHLYKDETKPPEANKPPSWFCIVRISSKLPCAVLNIGFVTSTPGHIRHNTCEALKKELAALSYMPSPAKSKENVCCVLLQKPLEKILIRYERLPNDFSTVIFPDGTQPPNTTMAVPGPLTGSLFTTLSRYLYHKRWIWSASHSSNPRLLDNAISRILTTLTRMRIKEGFSFAHSSSGIITMVLELWMEPSASCVVQYVLFPPHRAWWGEEVYSGSEEEDFETEYESELQMVTEVWIEPQHGRVQTSNNSRISYMNNKYYYELADVISQIDLQCINSLLTMEHLSLMCQEKNRSFSVDTNITFSRQNSTTIKNILRKNSKCNLIESPNFADESTWYPITSPRIEHIPFKFDPINILPLCHQTELLFSMFIERKDKSLRGYESDKSNKLLLDNIQEHLTSLHDQEIFLTREDSDKFTRQIVTRHKNLYPYHCPISEYRGVGNLDEFPASQWRCFIKGISITHVILTFIPSNLSDLKALVHSDSTNIPSLSESRESVDRTSSRGSNFSDVPINVTNSLTLPIYVYDCPLALLVNAYVQNPEETKGPRDVYEDHRFKSTDFIQDEYLKLKTDECENKSDDNYDIPDDKDRSSLRHHCKTLVLVHTKCFTNSLFMALHRDIYVHCTDVQSAVDQCEECITEIDITDYILTICGHIKQTSDDNIQVQELRQATACNELKSLHSLIKEKFFKMVNVAFIPIPTNPEYYFCRYYTSTKPDNKIINNNNISDEEISNPPSERDFSVYSDGFNIVRLENGIGDVITSDICPLFLHIVCTLRYNGHVSNTPLRVLPTCLGELTENIDAANVIDKKKVQVTLDIFCLTLPTEVQNVITEYSAQGLRTTSFSSDGFQPSIASSTSETSVVGEIPEPLMSLPENQRNSIVVLRDEIKWLLKDEIATALLDVDSVSLGTLEYVMRHVADSKSRSSCIMDVISLNFVFGSNQSHSKFVEEFARMKIPNYKLVQEGELYYLAKDTNFEPVKQNGDGFDLTRPQMRYTETIIDVGDVIYSKDFDEIASQPSDMSSVSGSVLGTDGTGYDEDVSNDDDDYEWLHHLNMKRTNLPNFWLVTKVEQETVTIYFHCRFLELAATQVLNYLEVQRMLSDEIRELCKKVNQSLLLQSLYETRICDSLLEPDDNPKDWPASICSSPISRNSSYHRLRSMDETSDESEIMTSSVTLSEASLNFKPGYFKCPVVWKTHFVLHPRLKTGPGKSGLSRGILALKNILEKFSVSNRTNMFVYRDDRNNVFYLRLHENVQNSSAKNAPLRPLEYENAIVSRSPSIASLPLGQTKSQLQYEQSLTSVLSDDIRPRVRSFGEKESKDGPNEDTLILKVHGITEAGNDVQCELVQVLQNRLDDAVLEFLSVMLARNSMCPLTPEDVQFIQKPFRLPEVVIKLSMQDFVLQWMDSFIHYLKQNLLQFLNMPKYTDNRSHYHFKDYSEADQAVNRNNDDSIFIYNQSQNPSCGNRGIACIALGVVYNSEIKPSDITQEKFEEIFDSKSFQTMVSSKIIGDDAELPPVHLEFRLWKQGRVNIDNLAIKLREAISQATWDLVMEYLILTAPLCEDAKTQITPHLPPIHINSSNLNLSKEIEFNCLLDVGNRQNIKVASRRKLETVFSHRKRVRRVNPPTSKATRSITFDDYERDKEMYLAKMPVKPLTKLNAFETGDEGALCKNYSKFLPGWLEFGASLMAPSVRKQKINLTNAHLPGTTIKELLNFVQDVPKAFRVIPSHPLCEGHDEVFVPHDPKTFLDKCVIISRNFDNWKASTAFRGTLDYPDFMGPHALKHTQKFVPAVINNKFVPRQKILWILIQCDSILIYTYNWARDNIEKLVSNCSKLGQWLSMRSCFLNSVSAQKLGLFHNQALVQKGFSTSNNPYTCMIGSTPSMVEFPRDDNRKSLTNTPNLSHVLDAFRDSFHTLKYNANDPVGVFSMEMQEMKHAEKKSRDEMKILHSMYQSRTSTTTVPQIFLLMQNSRIIHYCHTPLLFLPEWRLKSAATRDHSLCSPTHRTQKNALERDSWHTELCYGFFCEYRRYLQTLGFMPLQIDNSDKKQGIWARDNSSYNFVFYIQKTIMGGILIFTVEFNEPFFTTRLHAIECNRLQTITSRASINRFTLCFLDECDRVKILMHLHSFTYDYHLRCIYNYISNNSGVNKVCDRYNATKFFDDFMKYYTKAPNFARNLIHADTITITNLVTEGKQLYDYLLTNVNQYNFKVLDMDKGDGEIEYILVQVTSNPQVSYKDSHDREHTDEFEITLVVYNLCAPYSPTDNVLHLKYYLILTSKREIYPKSEVEPKLGKFRTVSSTARSLSALEKNLSDLETSTSKHEDDNYELSSSDEHIIFNSESDKSDDQPIHQPSTPQVEISPESVNYLGYYSSHEQLMQQMILDKANTTQKHIKEMVAKGMVHCRTHLLWNKLVAPQDANSLTYDEFMELKSLAKLEHLCDVHPNLGPLLNQPLSWYQGLAKLLLAKYNEQNRTFASLDGNIQHYVILHPRYFGAFMLLSIDLQTSRGDLYAVYREPHKQEDAELCLAYRKNLLDGFVNYICFYLWNGMI
ncbi:KICSTOR complex protein SZT2 isoform X3 [Tribolium castaneum]|uniref:KICSTOR complex protein SZT2 isoform X3 n=1 Tax=Tribolium castaneum TaxID=7070 RepID=UPI00046C287E|nr:PREDICTED: protein SZT2 isoform X3 [Tribolium castaneum]|eukprot:XP_008200755.1 PREDICTED: protein SZT2 isoform X3 [Tribolium castaneum]